MAKPRTKGERTTKLVRLGEIMRNHHFFMPNATILFSIAFEQLKKALLLGEGGRIQYS